MSTRSRSWIGALVAVALLGGVAAASPVPRPFCQHRPLSVPGYQIPSRFDPPWVLSAAEHARLDGAWSACAGKPIVRGATCAGRQIEQWNIEGSMCERTAGGRTEVGFCRATRVLSGVYKIVMFPDDDVPSLSRTITVTAR